MMAKLLIDHSPRAVIVAWDQGWSGREKVYAEYKSQRKSRPDLLKEQWPHLAPLAEAFGFKNVARRGLRGRRRDRHPGTAAADAGMPVMIVSGDRDVYQLVRDGVRVMTTSRGVTDTKIYDHDGVVERYGVPPELVTDFIGLKGDTSDNIPGVPGIGDKTAAELLQRFGSLEKVLELRRRDLGGEAKAEPDRARRGCARSRSSWRRWSHDIDVPIEIAERAARAPGRLEAARRRRTSSSCAW